MTDHKSHDAVFEGLAAGLTPADLDLPNDTITVDVALLQARDRLRIVRATEENVKLQRRIADAAERQADAFETLMTLFASTIGVGTAMCGATLDGTLRHETVNFIRTGLGRKNFACDGDSLEAAKADDE